MCLYSFVHVSKTQHSLNNITDQKQADASVQVTKRYRIYNGLHSPRAHTNSAQPPPNPGPTLAQPSFLSTMAMPKTIFLPVLPPPPFVFTSAQSSHIYPLPSHAHTPSPAHAHTPYPHPPTPPPQTRPHPRPCPAHALRSARLLRLHGVDLGRRLLDLGVRVVVIVDGLLRDGAAGVDDPDPVPREPHEHDAR